MPTYLLTMHAYRSWTEDNPRGYVQRGRRGIQPPRPRLARHRASISTSPPVHFNREQMAVAVRAAHEVCRTLQQHPLACSCTATHLHVLVEVADGERRDGSALTGGAPEQPVTAEALSARIKSIVGWRLSQQLGTTGNRWFSRGKDITVVKNRAHRQHLIETYLPRHAAIENGIYERSNASNEK